MNSYGTQLDEHTVQFVRILPGPIERIWAYIADSSKRGEWFASGELPSQVGESFELRFKHSELSPNQAPPPAKFAEMDKTGHSGREKLLALEPPRRMAMTFGLDWESGVSEAEFLLAYEGDPKDNRVRLTLTHRKIPTRDYAIDVSGGWHSHLDILQDKAEGKVPPAFWDVWRAIEGQYQKRYS
jgi:uncharacterized protein YndB with AHSA1/START domain